MAPGRDCWETPPTHANVAVRKPGSSLKLRLTRSAMTLVAIESRLHDRYRHRSIARYFSEQIGSTEEIDVCLERRSGRQNFRVVRYDVFNKYKFIVKNALQSRLSSQIIDC